MLINNSQNIEALVKEFNKFQVQEKKSNALTGFAKKMQKKVYKLLHREEYKQLKNQLSEQLHNLDLIKYDNTSIRDRKTPAKTKDILHAIERYQNEVKTHQDSSKQSEDTSENHIGSFKEMTNKKSVNIHSSSSDLENSFSPDHLEAMTKNNTDNTKDSIFKLALLEIQNKNAEEKNKIITSNMHEKKHPPEDIIDLPEISKIIYPDIPEKEIPDKLQEIENTFGRITSVIENIDDPIFQQLQKKYQNIKTTTNHSKKLSFKERQNILDVHERALSYLSDIMGIKMTHNNSNITDLGDTLRPTKVAEKFALLYDDEYTDLLDTVPGSESIKPIIDKMFTYLISLYDDWLQIRDSVTQSDDFAQMSYYSNVTNTVGNSSKQNKDKLQDIFFQSGEAPTLKKGFILSTNHFAEEINNGHSDFVNNFVNKANQTIAAMMCQDAPLILKWSEHGNKYDKDNTNPFTKSGTHVDYNVWPTLYLDNGVTLLSKGVCSLYYK